MIELIDGYYIKAEPIGYSLCFGEPKKSEKDGKVFLSHNIVGYYGTVVGAIEGCRRELVHDFVSESSVSLVQAVTAIREINDDIAKLLKEINA